MTTVNITGLAEIIQRLSADLDSAIQPVLLAAAEEAKSYISPYPPAPARRPGKPYYLRGTGMVSARGKVSKKSENLGRKWAVRPAGAAMAVLENPVSYGPYVHSAEEQAAVHKRSGWKTDEETVKYIEESDVIQRAAEQAVVKLLER